MGVILSEVADDIDRLITLDFNRRGVIKALYQAGREKAGRPLVLSAAEALTKAVTPGSVVLVATGWPDRPWVDPSIGELDGPPGAALLARSLHAALGAIPVFLIEKELEPPMRSTAVAAGLVVLPPSSAIAAWDSPAPVHAAAILPFPKNAAEARAEAARLIEQYHPTAVVAVEKGSANEKGVIHNARGMDTTEAVAKTDELVGLARERGILTIGIGDGGNEVGMGLIAETVKRHVPYGDRCACPCGAGIAPVQPTDVLVTATVSNWGAHGIAACLAVMKSRLDVLHDEAMELRTLRDAADSGLIDGNTGYIDPGADGLPAPTHAAIITLMRQLVTYALSPKGLAVDAHVQQRASSSRNTDARQRMAEPKVSEMKQSSQH